MRAQVVFVSCVHGRHFRAAGLPFRNDVVTGPGGKQILVDDPSGNPIELFEPGEQA